MKEQKLKNSKVIARFGYDTKIISGIDMSKPKQHKYVAFDGNGGYIDEHGEYTDGSIHNGSESVSVITKDPHNPEVLNPDGTTPFVCDFIKIDFTEENLKKRITEPEMAEKYGVDE